MAIALYMDEHVPAAITEELRLREIDVLTVQEDGRGAVDDDVVLARANELGRVVFSEDADMLRLASHYQHTSIHFAGVIHTNFQKKRIGYYVTELELICKACDLEEFVNAVQYV